MWSRCAWAVLLVLAGCSNDYDVKSQVDPVLPAYSRIEVSPPKLDYGEVGPGVVETMTFTIESTGDIALEIDEVKLADDIGAFTVLTDVPETLKPGKAVDVEVAFEAQDTASYQDWVVINSDAKNAPRVEVQVEANIPKFGKPIAKCSANPTEIVPISEQTVFDGRQSYDPFGTGIADFVWTWEARPPGPLVPPPRQSPRWDFRPQLAGTFTAKLVVQNGAGIWSDPCFATVEAYPNEKLWVEMFWGTRHDDMDLHLLAPGGTLETATDCYYSNCKAGITNGNGLPWGVGGVKDNPILDLDDIPETGPENINIEEPAAGTYTVIVHDYQATWAMHAANPVTVNIYSEGQLLWSDTRAISGENTYTTFATVTFPAGTVTPQ